MNNKMTWLQPEEVPNRYSNSKVFRVHMHEFDTEGTLVTCRSMDEALDLVTDYVEEQGWEGLFIPDDEAREREEEGDELLRAGNHGRALSGSDYLHIVEENWQYLCTWTEEGFTLTLWDTQNTDRMGKSVLAYNLTDSDWNDDPIGSYGKYPIFVGSDFSCSPLHAVDSDETVKSLLEFLSLRKGDVDSEYFENYTERQVNWRDTRAENLQNTIFYSFEEDEINA